MASKKCNRDNIQIKSAEYKIAINKYNTIAGYVRIEIYAGIIIIALQILCLLTLFYHHSEINIIALTVTLIIAYIATDFINGLVHMIVDNNTNYTSITGPFVAAFHLHHSQLTYKNRHPIKIYFFESSHKFWLLFYLGILFIFQITLHINFYLNLFL